MQLEAERLLVARAGPAMRGDAAMSGSKNGCHNLRAACRRRRYLGIFLRAGDRALHVAKHARLKRDVRKRWPPALAIAGH